MKRVLVALLMTALISIGAMAALDTDDYVGGVYFLNLDQAVLMGFTSTGLFDMIGGARFDNTTLATTLTITETNIELVGAMSFTGDMVITSVLKGLDIDVTSAGADTNYFGIDNDVIQGSVSAEAYLSRGNLIGAANSIAAIGDIDATYATYSLSNMVMAADTESNQLYGGIFMSHVSGAHTLTLHDGLVGAQFAIEVDAGVTDVTGGIVAAAFMYPNVQTAITSLVYGAYVKCTNYTDYGVSVIVESNNISAGLEVRTKDSAVLPIGLQFSTTSGSITKEIELQNGETISNAVNGTIVLDGDVTATGDITVTGGDIIDGAGGGTAVTNKATSVETMGAVQTSVVTFTLTGDNDLDLADGDHGTGIKVFDFPEGRIYVLGVVMNGSITTSASFNATVNDQFVVAMGSAVGADDNALSGTEVDLIPSTAIDTDSGAGANTQLTNTWHTELAAAAFFDGTTTPVDAYVNVACPDAANTTASTYAITGTVTITWANLGDY